MNVDKALEEAKRRLEKGREAIKQRKEEAKDVEEPNELRSGVLDELDLVRRQKRDNGDDAE